MDWCTYIIECLIKKKIQWNRKYHFNGPAILLLVLYTNSCSPIKWCTSNYLLNLEKEKFTNDNGNDPDVVQEHNDEGVEEGQDWEQYDFAEYGRDRVPTNAEGMKKYVSAVLKKAVEWLNWPMTY